MEHIFEQQVFYSDTDAYGVVWHGSYLRWLEMGRVFYCEQLGLDLISLKENDIVIPVTNLNVRYKASAKLDDTIIIETWIEKYNSLSVTFAQVIKSKATGKVFIKAQFDVVATSRVGKLYRKMPQMLTDAFEKGLEKCIR